MDFSRNILVVDDEPNLRNTLALILKHEGYSVKTAASAEESLTQLGNSSYALVFLDLKMPGINGLQLLPEIKKMYPDLRVLVFTASDSLETRNEAAQLGAWGYFEKPMEPSKIVKLVNQLLMKSVGARSYPAV